MPLFEQHEVDAFKAEGFTAGKAAADNRLADVARADATQVERARCLAIIALPGAAKHPLLAQQLVKGGATPAAAAEALNQRSTPRITPHEAFLRHMAAMAPPPADSPSGAASVQELWGNVMGF